MTIERQVDFLGRIIKKTQVVPGYQEILIDITPFNEENPSKTKLVDVRILDFDTLEYYQGQYTGFGTEISAGLWEFDQKGSSIKLKKGQINQVDIQGGRKWWGGRVSYKWRPSPDDLDLFIEAATGHRPIFSK